MDGPRMQSGFKLAAAFVVLLASFSRPRTFRR